MTDGVFWVLRSGAAWRDLPENLGPYRLVIIASFADLDQSYLSGSSATSPRFWRRQGGQRQPRPSDRAHVPGWLWKPPENAARISGDSLLLSRDRFFSNFLFRIARRDLRKDNHGRHPAR